METEGQISFRHDATTLRVRFSGTWRLRRGLPTAALVERELKSSGNVRCITFDTDELAFWDSSVLAFLVDVSELCRKRGVTMDRAGLPAGLHRLLDLAEAVPEKAGARKEALETSFLERIVTTAIGCGASLGEMLAFLGDMTLTFVRLFGMKVRFRAVDLFLLIQQSSAQALPIVTIDQFSRGGDSRFCRRRAAQTVRRADLRRRPRRQKLRDEF